MIEINALLKLSETYETKCLQDLVKIGKIRKLLDGKYRVLSQKGKNLGTYKSREAAEKRLKQVEYFKHFDHSKIDDGVSVIDLTDIDEFTYSAIIRKLREKTAPEMVRQFLLIFKRQFDKAVKNKMHKPERIALQNTLIKFNKFHKIRFDKKMVKCATITELGNAEQVGKYLSDIVRFTLQRIPPDKRQQAMDRLKQKFTNLSEIEISSKQLPQSSALGQAITFVKHVLFNHDAKYVREVLNNLVRNL